MTCAAGTYAVRLADAGAGASDAGDAGAPVVPGAVACSACAGGTYALTGANGCTMCGDCDDGDPCTDDICDMTAGCVHNARSSCGAGPSSSASSSSGVHLIDDPSSGMQYIVEDSGCASAGTSSNAPGILAALGAACAIALGLRRRR